MSLYNFAMQGSELVAEVSNLTANVPFYIDDKSQLAVSRPLMVGDYDVVFTLESIVFSVMRTSWYWIRVIGKHIGKCIITYDHAMHAYCDN